MCSLLKSHFLPRILCTFVVTVFVFRGLIGSVVVFCSRCVERDFSWREASPPIKENIRYTEKDQTKLLQRSPEVRFVP